MRHAEKFEGSIDDFALRLIFTDGDSLDGTPTASLVDPETLTIADIETYEEADAVSLVVAKVAGGTRGERSVLRFVANTVAGRRVVEEIEIRVI